MILKNKGHEGFVAYVEVNDEGKLVAIKGYEDSEWKRFSPRTWSNQERFEPVIGEIVKRFYEN